MGITWLNKLSTFMTIYNSINFIVAWMEEKVIQVNKMHVFEISKIHVHIIRFSIFETIIKRV